MRGVTGSDLYDSVREEEKSVDHRVRDPRGRICFSAATPQPRSPLFLGHDLNWAQLVAPVAGAQLSICVGAPRVQQPLIGQCQGVGVA